MKYFLAAAYFAAMTGPAGAASINVLWTSGSTIYNDNIVELAGEASTFDPGGDGALDWNLTLWDGSAIDFTTYDVLVVGSTYAVGESYSSGDGGNTGFFGNGVSAQGVLDNKDAIADARGSRTFLSGQDADWHDLNNLPDRDDGPKGFMINAVNWAASGTGLGIVSMVDRFLGGPSSGVGWWDNPESFLFDEVAGATFGYQSNTVNIGAGQESFPINEGLTSTGLSDWNTSSHACFDEIAGFTRINFAPQGSGQCGVTIVTSGEEGGDTGGGDTPANVVPLPAAGWLLLAGIGGLGLLRRRG